MRDIILIVLFVICVVSGFLFLRRLGRNVMPDQKKTGCFQPYACYNSEEEVTEEAGHEGNGESDKPGSVG